MNEEIVVVGGGYAGTAAIKELQQADPTDSVTWISASPSHLVKHELHRVIRHPSLGEGLSIPLSPLVEPPISFHQGRVMDLDVRKQSIELADGTDISYETLLLSAGARTAYYGIPGLEEHAHVLETVSDAQAIHRSILEAATDGTARIVVGGGGLSGVQVAGEITELANDRDIRVHVTLVEALDTILPNEAHPVRERAEAALESRNINIVTGSPVTEVSESTVTIDGDQQLPYDECVWTGGLTGQDFAMSLERAHNRIETADTFATSDPDIFAVGDIAAIDQPGGIAPPTAQAAWQAGPVAARNVLRSRAGQPLESWRYEPKGTLVSIGETAIAHDVVGVPISTFGSYPARFLKKMIAARWIASVQGANSAVRLWRYL